MEVGEERGENGGEWVRMDTDAVGQANTWRRFVEVASGRPCSSKLHVSIALTSFSCSLRLRASLSEATVSSLSLLFFSLKSFSVFVSLFFMAEVSSSRLHLSSSSCGRGWGDRGVREGMIWEEYEGRCVCRHGVRGMRMCRGEGVRVCECEGERCDVGGGVDV